MPSNPHAADSELEPLTSSKNMEGDDSDKRQHLPTAVTSYHDSPDASTSLERTTTDQTLLRSTSSNPDSSHDHQPSRIYKVYSRRFLGLAQITLLNIIVSWNWLTFAPVSTTTSSYLRISESAVNWLSTGFLFAFVVASPVAVWTLNRSVKSALVTAAALMLVGSWVRYAGIRAGEHGYFGLTVFGQLIIGLAQPFVLAAPTRYSDLWFTESGRISATAVASLGNPFGGALGQLINPFWATKAGEIPDMVLYVAILTTLICLPTPFLRSTPPTPPTPTSGAATHISLSWPTLKNLYKTPSFHLLSIPFTIYVSTFNATSSLLNQILEPYDFTEDEAGIGGALLILCGLAAAAISSPLLDRRKGWRIPVIKILVPCVALMYLLLVFTPGTRSLAANYVVLSMLGAASFALVPLALEMMVEVTYGVVGPEVSSVLGWTGGQLGGGVLILFMDALKSNGNDDNEHGDGNVKGNLDRALRLQAGVAWIGVPCVLVLGFWGTGRSRRLASQYSADT